MSCQVTDHSYSDHENGDSAQFPESGQDHTGPTLVVSDAPETLGTQVGNSGILYRATIPLGSNLNFRVFLWHVNNQGGSRNLRIRAKLTSSSVTASNRRYQTNTAATSTDLTLVGKEIACVQQYGTFDNSQSNVTIGTTFVELWSGTVAIGYLRACLYEFSISAPSEDCDLVIETVFDTGGPISGADPVSPNEPDGVTVHIRGWWPHSEILFPVEATLDADPESTAAPCMSVGVVENTNAPELASTAFGWQGNTIDHWGTAGGNKGLFGAAAKYSLVAENGNDVFNNSLSLKLQMRNNGGFFSGAGKTVSPIGTDKTIKRLSADGQPKLSNLDTGANMGIAHGETKAIVCSVSPGGASTLPVNLYFCSGRLTE